jgi:gamma-glutamylcysteine synthetase
VIEVADSGVTQAERLIRAYHGAWERDVRRVFEAALI